MLELGEWQYVNEKKVSSINHLISLLNFAHDKGGRRVILVNNTHFSNEALFQQIIAQLPEHEKERSRSRLELLLCENEETIFSVEGYDGKIDDSRKTLSKKAVPPTHHFVSSTLFTFFANQTGTQFPRTVYETLSLFIKNTL